MKDEKAFSLVELIAAITIMGILMLVAIPNVTRTVEKNKQTTYINDAKKLITLAKKKYTEDTTIAEPTRTKCLIFTLKDLELTDLKGPNNGKYNSKYSYVTINYDKTNNNYTYGVQLMETYGKRESHRGIAYLNNASNTTLKRNRVEKVSTNVEKYTSLSELSSGMGSSCPDGIYYVSNTTTPSYVGASPGDVLTITYRSGDNVENINREETCTVKENETSCTINLPDYTVSGGYSKVGWSTSRNARSGLGVDTVVALTKDVTYYANAVDNIAPEIKIITDPDDVFSEEKRVEVIVSDLGSGLSSGASFEYAFSLSNTDVPTNYKKADISYADGDKEAKFIVVEQNLNGSYYLWVRPTGLKDKNGNIQKSVAISSNVFNFSGSVPVCNISGGKDLKIDEKTTFTLSCTDEVVGMKIKELTVDDFYISSNSAEVTDVTSPIEIPHGYKYDITVQGVSVGTFDFGLEAHWMSNNVNASNPEVISSRLISVGGLTHTATYQVGDNVLSIGKNADVCATVGNSKSCTVTSPNIVPISGFTVEGWKNQKTGEMYSVGEEITLSEDTIFISTVIDEDSPKIVFEENGSSTYTKEKTVKVNITDSASGIKSGASIRYGFSTSNDSASPPTIMKKAELSYSDGAKSVSFEASSKDEAGTDYLTGNMYLWLMVESLSDVSDNKYPEYYVISSGTFAFNNTGPICTFITPAEIELGSEGNVTLECTSEISEMKKIDLAVSDIVIKENSGLVIKKIDAPISILSGYKYNIVVEPETADTSVLILNPGKIADKLGNTNELVISSDIKVKAKTLKIKYQKGEYIESIEKEGDTCTIYKKEDTTCTVILPGITPMEGYSASGFYDEDETTVSMPGSEYVLGHDTVLTARGVDDLPPRDIDIDLTYSDVIAISSRDVKVTLEDLGSGLESGIKIKYGFTQKRGEEPTSYKTITPTYVRGAKKIEVNIPLSDGISDLLWVVPVNYKDIEGNENTKTVESAHYFTVNNQVVLKENPVKEYLITENQMIHVSLKLNIVDKFKNLDMDTSKMEVYIGALDAKRGGVDFSKRIENCNFSYDKSTHTLDIDIPVTVDMHGELLVELNPNVFGYHSGLLNAVALTPNITFRGGTS